MEDLNKEIVRKWLKEEHNIRLLKLELFSDSIVWEFITDFGEDVTIELTRLSDNKLELFGDVESHTEYETLTYDEIMAYLAILLPQNIHQLRLMNYRLYR